MFWRLTQSQFYVWVQDGGYENREWPDQAIFAEEKQHGVELGAPNPAPG